MCLYYHHIWSCGHEELVFACLCAEQYWVQVPCDIVMIWHSFTLERRCWECNAARERRKGRTEMRGEKGEEERDAEVEDEIDFYQIDLT